MIGYWNQQSQTFSDFSIGDSDFVMAIDAKTGLIMMKSSNFEWTALPKLKNINGESEAYKVACGENHTALAVGTKDSSLYQYNRHRKAFMPVNSVSIGGARDISVGSSNLMFGVSSKAYNGGSDFEPFQFFGESQFLQHDEGVSSIACGRDGCKFAINSANQLYFHVTDRQGWMPMNNNDKKFKLIDLDTMAFVVAVDTDDEIWGYSGESEWFQLPFIKFDGTPINEKITKISVSEENVVFVLTDAAENNLYTFIPAIEPPPTK